MTDIYAIETSAGTAGLAVRDDSGFRFYASDHVFNTLESQQYARLAEIYSAVNRLTAPPRRPAVKPQKGGRSRQRSSNR